MQGMISDVFLENRIKFILAQLYRCFDVGFHVDPENSWPKKENIERKRERVIGRKRWALSASACVEPFDLETPRRK